MNDPIESIYTPPKEERKQDIDIQDLVLQQQKVESQSNQSNPFKMNPRQMQFLEDQLRNLPNPTLYDKALAHTGFVAIILGLLTFPLGMYFFIFGNIYCQTVCVIILLYQYLLADENKYWRKILRSVKPENYFEKCGLIIDSKDCSKVELSETKSLFCFHPHGIFCIGMLMHGLIHPVISKSYVSGSRALLYTPFTGLIVIMFGLRSVNHKTFKKYMEKGKNISFIPGGFEEATITTESSDRIFINSRKGFIKYSLQYGYKVHPIYIFGENKLMTTYNGLEWFRLVLNQLKIPSVVFYGKKFLLFPDDKVQFITVVSEGIQFPLIENPTAEEVEKYHQIYVDELEYIYYKYKDSLGGSEFLEIL